MLLTRELTPGLRPCASSPSAPPARRSCDRHRVALDREKVAVDGEEVAAMREASRSMAKKWRSTLASSR
jgi:hypothetical protein